MATMTDQQLHEVLTDPIATQLLSASIPTRLAYAGRDGAPRVVPMGSWWTGSQLVMCTVPNAPKVAALQRDPRVAVTIDTEGMPPHVLLLRGRAEVTVVDGVPDEFLQAGHKQVPDEMFPQWEAEVRRLYVSMARIAVTPTWAKILDFETRIPQAVEELARQAGAAAEHTSDGRER